MTDTDGKLTDPLPQPTYTGYKFLGWYDKVSGGSKIADGKVFDKSETVYAHWLPLPEPQPESDDKKSNLPLIIGGSIAGAVAVGLIVGAVIFLRKR